MSPAGCTPLNDLHVSFLPGCFYKKHFYVLIATLNIYFVFYETFFEEKSFKSSKFNFLEINSKLDIILSSDEMQSFISSELSEIFLRRLFTSISVVSIVSIERSSFPFFFYLFVFFFFYYFHYNY